MMRKPSLQTTLMQAYVQLLTRQSGAEIHVIYVIEDITHHESWYGDFDKKSFETLQGKAERTIHL